MHILQRKSATVGPLHDINDLTHSSDLQTKNVVDENRAVHIGVSETIGFRVKLWVRGYLTHAKRIKISSKVAAHTVGTDQHQRADAV